MSMCKPGAAPGALRVAHAPFDTAEALLLVPHFCGMDHGVLPSKKHPCAFLHLFRRTFKRAKRDGVLVFVKKPASIRRHGGPPAGGGVPMKMTAMRFR